MKAAILSSVTAVAMLLLSASISNAQQSDSPPHNEGQCGGSMKGYDGRQYPCGAIRKPACNTNNDRCVCLEKIECGGRTNEMY
jgi:hypothetical protein